MHRILIITAFAAVCAFSPLAALAAGDLVQSWRTEGGWLTELRVHPNGARVCSTGKATHTPHTFGLSFVRSGRENMVLLVDEQEPPTETGAADMTFVQEGKTLGTLKVQPDGPAFASTDPTGPQAKTLISKLSPAPVTINVAKRRYEVDLAGITGAMAQLGSCEAQSG
jgi:hypothetical protein